MIAIPALAEVAIALLLVLLLLASVYLANFVASLIPSNIPVIGSWLHDAVSAAAAAAAASQRAVWDHGVLPVVNFILSPIQALRANFLAISNALTSLWTFSYVLFYGTIPFITNSLVNDIVINVAILRSETAQLGIYLEQKISDVGSYILTTVETWVSEARQYSLDLTNFALSTLAANVNALIAYSQTLYNDAVQYTQLALSTALTYADALSNTIVAWTSQELANLRGDIAQDVTDLEQYADTVALAAVVAGIDALTTDLEHELAPIWAAVAAGAITVEGVLGTDLPDILSGIKAIPRDLPLDIPLSIAGAAAIAIPMLKYLEQCGIPNCRNLSQYGRDLQDLLSLAGDVGFIGMFIELAHNPVQGAKDVSNVLTPILNDAISTGKELLSI